MKKSAYLFAEEIDRDIELLSDLEYFKRLGRSKLLQEELLPISRLALHLKKPGLSIDVEAFENDGPVDAHIEISGYLEKEFDIEVTCDHNYEKTLRYELLYEEGSTPFVGEIYRDKITTKVCAKQGTRDYEEYLDNVSNVVIDRFKSKNSKQYNKSTILIISFDEVKLYGVSKWKKLIDILKVDEVFSVNIFGAVYLFNSSTNELQRIA